ncbi:hypothetical protein LCGC14_2194130 [marine sediment metagenome]|uniref:Trigger factor C-terminal domain-containing protein n=1 Tax=marine sediment metagenome TaxID=412755 RepID=A0A0F9DIS7_9ZZZZ
MNHQVNMGWLQNEAARVAQQQAQREQAMGTKDFYNLESGYITYFRIAPPWSAAGAFGRPIGKHYQVQGSRSGNKGDICVANWPGLQIQCPLCAVYDNLYENSPRKSPPKEEAYQCRRREYFYVNAFILGRSPRVNQGTEEVPRWVDGAFEPMQEDPLRCRIVKLSPKSFNYFVTQYWQTKIDITSAYEGVLCMITVTGLKKATRYTENMAGTQGMQGFQPQQSPLFETNEHIAQALGTINDLDAIWKQPEQAREQGQLDEDDIEKSEEVLKSEYRAIAERRVRLGLLLSEVGRRNNIEVTNEEVNQAIVGESQRFPGHQREVVEHYQNNPQAQAELRAPLFENKVTDFVLELASVTERRGTMEELLRETEAVASGAKKKKNAGGKSTRKAKPAAPKKPAAAKKNPAEKKAAAPKKKTAKG